MSENSNWAYSVGTLETADQLESFGPAELLQSRFGVFFKAVNNNSCILNKAFLKHPFDDLSLQPTNPILQKKYFNILELTYLFVPQLSQT